MAYGVIEYNEHGNPMCEICGAYPIRIGTHVRWHHQMTAFEYKKEYGLSIHKGICNKESSLKSRVKALHYKNIESDKARSKAVRFKKGHAGRTKDKLSEQERLIIISRGKIWGKSANQKTKRVKAIRLHYCNRILKEIEGVDKWCRKQYGKQYSEDITSEVKYIALKKGKFEERGIGIATWLIDIAKKKYLNKFKYERFHPLNDEEKEFDSECYQNENIGTETILKVVENLIPTYRIPLKMKMEGYGVQEISEKTGLKLTTIKSAISAARKLLKEQLELV